MFGYSDAYVSIKEIINVFDNEYTSTLLYMKKSLLIILLLSST